MWFLVKDLKDNAVGEMISTVQGAKLHGNFKTPGFFSFSMSALFISFHNKNYVPKAYDLSYLFLLVKNVYDENFLL